MTTVLEPQKVKEVFTDGVLLHDIRWSTYESLLQDLPDTPGTRLTYDRGDLLIMVTSPEHDEINRIIATLIQTISEELEVEWRDFGSTTYQRRDLQRGFEPDSCFYFKNEAQMRGKKRLDMQVDPPPDLVVEIDITYPSLNKLPLFAAFGIQEVWRFDGAAMEFYVLSGSDYVKTDNSLALPQVTASVVTRFVIESNSAGRLEWVKKVRGWAEALKASQEP
jgi:Uma2 family endonuclease